MEERGRTPAGAGRGREMLERFRVAAARTRLRRGAAATVLVAAGFCLAVTPVVGDGLNRVAAPTSPVLVATRAASSTQVAGGGQQFDRAALAAAQTAGNGKAGKVSLESRVTDQPIVTEENKGSYVGVKCPKGSKAISGGILNKYINLLVSSSAPNHPISGKYTPRTWWLTVTNANIDGQGGSLPWRGVVNCLKPVKLKK